MSLHLICTIYFIYILTLRPQETNLWLSAQPLSNITFKKQILTSVSCNHFVCFDLGWRREWLMSVVKFGRQDWVSTSFCSHLWLPLESKSQKKPSESCLSQWRRFCPSFSQKHCGKAYIKMTIFTISAVWLALSSFTLFCNHQHYPLLEIFVL